MEGTKVAICPVATRAEAVALPNVAGRKMIPHFDQPTEGRIRQSSNPLWRARLARRTRRPVLSLGQHSREVLQSLGYSAAEISHLAGARVVVEGSFARRRGGAIMIASPLRAGDRP